MSASELIEKMRPMPAEEKRAFVEKVWEVYGEELETCDLALTSPDVEELDRRSEEALKNPGIGKPAEQVFAEIQERLITKS